MTVADYNIDHLIELTQKAMDAQENLSPALKLCIESLITLVIEQDKLIKSQQEEIKTLKLRVTKLENQLGLNSQNSHKPPSSDTPADSPRYPKRNQSNRSAGAQYGHPGSFLTHVDNPDEVIKIIPKGFCSKCNCDLSDQPLKLKSKRQVFDLNPKKYVIDYQQYQVKCFCNKKFVGSYPEKVSHHASYSNKVKSFITYFSQVQLIPAKRVIEIFDDCFDLEISEGTIFNVIRKANDHLSDLHEKMKEQLLSEEVLHADETPTKVNGSYIYIHTLCTKFFTFLYAHKNRGFKAIQEMGVLESYEGTLVHDCLNMYFSFLNMKHGTCGGHLGRDLYYAEHNEDQRWAHEMGRFLLDLNDYRNNYELSKEDIWRLERSYDLILSRGINSIKVLEKGAKSIALHKRFINRKVSILRFMYDRKVPFTNNEAERSFRFVKLKQKISTQFKSMKGAKDFARIRSYTGTLRKQKKNLMEGLMRLFEDSEKAINGLFKPILV